MLQNFARKIFGSKNERELKRLWPIVERVNALEDKYKKMSDAELSSQTAQFKERISRGESLDEILPEAFAVVREAGIRTLGMRHFDVQLIGGMVLHEGKISEMKTGEGKTLCATLPVYLNALTGKGVHLVTVNDYLARRDAEWMSSIYGFLGLSTGVTLHGLSAAERAAAYRSDITYGQNNEFGFDYLRDNMKLELSEMVQRGHEFAIVDEVDSILVDEARTPLIISGPSEDATEKYHLADQLVRNLRQEVHYTIELKSKQTMLTDEGVRYLEELLKIENLYDPRNIEIVHHVSQSLKAHATMKRDVDYVVRNNQVVIVDEFTGRLMPGRRWSDGLHQAVEAKEGVTVARENQTVATITFQNYFRMYKKLAGMTGTADTEAVEFKKIYNLDVIVIPTNKPMVRSDYPDVVFAGENGKFKAVCDEIEECHKQGQPVLVGTASIAKSEVLSEILKTRGVRHHVLNAKQHEREAEIVAQAGRMGAVTISTNMAGRGTDIVLGGNPDFLAADAAGTKDPEDAEFQNQREQFKALCAAEREQVVASGGLHIIGTERHESRRIDNQLRGRSGRQGDPGSSRFYVSLEDDLMKRFGGERMQAIMSRVGLKEDDAIEGALVARAIENAQKKVEAHHFEIRKHLLEYDDVLNKQREVIYKLRDKMLKDEGVESEVSEMVPELIEEIIIQRVTDKDDVEAWDVSGMFEEFRRQFAVDVAPQPFLEKQKLGEKDLAQQIFDSIKEQAIERYNARKIHFGPARMVKLERIVLLQAIDYFWKEHLSNIDHLKEGIGLRGYGQKNPLFEYQKEAFELFALMLLAIKSAVLQNIFIPDLPSDEELNKLEAEHIEQQRLREAETETIHQDVLEAPEEDKSTIDDGLTRAERRRRGAENKGIQGSEGNREGPRKKSKLARQGRKQGR